MKYLLVELEPYGNKSDSNPVRYYGDGKTYGGKCSTKDGSAFNVIDLANGYPFFFYSSTGEWDFEYYTKSLVESNYKEITFNYAYNYWSNYFPNNVIVRCPNAISFTSYNNFTEYPMTYEQLEELVKSLPDWNNEYSTHEITLNIPYNLQGTEKITNLIQMATDKNWTVYESYN